MSDTQETKADAGGGKWPAEGGGGAVSAPITIAALANAAASGARRDLLEYLRLRRKPG